MSSTPSILDVQGALEVVGEECIQRDGGTSSSTIQDQVQRSSSSTMPGLTQTNLYHQQNLQHNQQANLNLTMYQQNLHSNPTLHQQILHQTVDPKILEGLIENLVNTRVQERLHDMQGEAEEVIHAQRQQYDAQLLEVQRRVQEEAFMALQNQQKQLESRMVDVQRDRDQEIKAVQDQAQARLQEIQQDRNREIMALRTQAENMFQELQSGRDQELRAMHQQMMAMKADHDRPPTPDDVLTQVYPTPFDTISDPGRAPSVASLTPPNLCYCGVCGNQNVRGRGTCWRCNSTLDANNATVLTGNIQEQGQPHLVQPQSQGLVVAGANTPASPTRASIAAVGRQMNLGLSGSAGVQVELSQGGAPSFDPRGPTIQGGVVFRGQSHPVIPEFFPVSTPLATPVAGEGPSQDHDDSSSDTSRESRRTGSVMPQGSEAPPIWLNPGETEDQIYKIKHLRNITISRLPTDATTCREWRAALMAAISRIDLSTRDVLVKYTSHCMDAGRGRQFRRMLQNDNMFIAFNKHIAAELIKQDVLSTNSDLAHELTSYVESCTSQFQGPKGMALLNIVSSYYETGLSRSVALDQMHLLSLQLQGKGAKDLTEFVRKANYILHGLKDSDRPSPSTMFQWLWQQVKKVPMLSRITDRVRESSATSSKRSFNWLWSQIAEELRERRHDYNYDNLSKGLKDMPHSVLACPAPSNEEKGHKGKGKKGGRFEDTYIPTAAAPAGDNPKGKGKEKTQAVCSMHAAGFCRFGEKCRNQHVGNPGSDAAKKAYIEYNQGKKDDKSAKAEKGKGKEKGDKGKKGKGQSGSTAPAAAAVAAAATQPVAEAQAIWKSFVEFTQKALPALHVFLKLSVPILASLVNSIVETLPSSNVELVAGMLHPTVEEFRSMSLELIGDTGAAFDIGSIRALEDQGFDRGVIEPWLKCLDNPVHFATGGGPQTSKEAMRVYAKHVGELNLHLLKNCPLAMSIGKIPFIALDHRKCRVWCPVEERWYARRVQNNVPIFALQSEAKAEGGGITFTHKDRLVQPALAAQVRESDFCGSCMERMHACICDVDHEAHADPAIHEQQHHYASRLPYEQPTIEKPNSDDMKEHRRRQHRKDNRRRKWEAMKRDKKEATGKASRPPSGSAVLLPLMDEAVTFFKEQAKDHEGKIAKRFTELARKMEEENLKYQRLPACPATRSTNVRSKNKTTLPGHGHLIEFCTESDSGIGRIGESYGITVTRCQKDHLNVEDPSTKAHLRQKITELPGTSMWGSLPCGPWSQWQYLNSHRYGRDFREKLDRAREKSKGLLADFCELAREAYEEGGEINFEWPRHATGWRLEPLANLVRDLDMYIVDFDGCAVGFVDPQGCPFLKKWRLATTSERLARKFQEMRCTHDSSFKHSTIEGSKTAMTARYPDMMCEMIHVALFPDIVHRHVPAMPVSPLECHGEPHRHRDEGDQPTKQEPLIFESMDTFACAADLEIDEAPADDEAEVRESREARLAREARSLDHMMLHHRKNPMCEHCQRGRMLKRYFHRVRSEPEEDELPYTRPEGFGGVIEADNIFPSVESRGIGGEQTALLVRDRFRCIHKPSGVSSPTTRH